MENKDSLSRITYKFFQSLSSRRKSIKHEILRKFLSRKILQFYRFIFLDIRNFLIEILQNHNRKFEMEIHVKVMLKGEQENFRSVHSSFCLSTEKRDFSIILIVYCVWEGYTRRIMCFCCCILFFRVAESLLLLLRCFILTNTHKRLCYTL